MKTVQFYTLHVIHNNQSVAQEDEIFFSKDFAKTAADILSKTVEHIGLIAIVPVQLTEEQLHLLLKVAA